MALIVALAHALTVRSLQPTAVELRQIELRQSTRTIDFCDAFGVASPMRLKAFASAARPHDIDHTTTSVQYVLVRTIEAADSSAEALATWSTPSKVLPGDFQTVFS